MCVRAREAPHADAPAQGRAPGPFPLQRSHRRIEPDGAGRSAGGSSVTATVTLGRFPTDGGGGTSSIPRRELSQRSRPSESRRIGSDSRRYRSLPSWASCSLMQPLIQSISGSLGTRRRTHGSSREPYDPLARPLASVQFFSDQPKCRTSARSRRSPSRCPGPSIAACERP